MKTKPFFNQEKAHQQYSQQAHVKKQKMQDELEQADKNLGKIIYDVKDVFDEFPAHIQQFSNN